MLDALFPKDFVDNLGWWHTVTYYGKGGVETLFGICEWLTGKGTNYREVLSVNENHEISEHLKLGDQILIPLSLLTDTMKIPDPKRKGKRVAVEPPPPVETKAGTKAGATPPQPPTAPAAVSRVSSRLIG